MITAFEIAHGYEVIPNPAFVLALARYAFYRMNLAGYAHIQPQEEFIDGFVQGFIEAVARKENQHGSE